ncbi:hypothetical protein ElyMa_004890800 [Elysia marginata]|uniref:Uncharacterized protein n=1 Tax=Elysia marginata TaxID=1093978 RepID=A0AAV4IU48_9GAST|nr:hypothetical protein ElyMa_004890800 [Elysia marginata]
MRAGHLTIFRNRCTNQRAPALATAAQRKMAAVQVLQCSEMAKQTLRSVPEYWKDDADIIAVVVDVVWVAIDEIEFGHVGSCFGLLGPSGQDYPGDFGLDWTRQACK